MASSENKEHQWPGPCSKPTCAFLLVLLCTVEFNTWVDALSISKGVPTSYPPFRCSEVLTEKLIDEYLEVDRSGCNFFARSISDVNFSYYRSQTRYNFSNNLSDKYNPNISQCYSTRTGSGNWTLKVFRKNTINLKDFLKAHCSGLSGEHQNCSKNNKYPYRVTETYILSLPQELCRINISIIHEKNNDDCDFSSSTSLCTAVRNSDSRNNIKLPGCGNRAIDVNMEVLQRASGLKRISVPYGGVALKLNNKAIEFGQGSYFCDLLTMDALKLVPDLSERNLHLLVLLTFKTRDLSNNNNWTQTVHIHAVKVLRDLHELHLRSCNDTKHTDQLKFTYQNVTKFEKKVGFFNVMTGIFDYYSDDFWKYNSDWRTEEEDSMNNLINAENEVTVGGEGDVCDTLLNYLHREAGTAKQKTPGVQNIAYVLQFNVSTALTRNVTRNWTVSVMFAYMTEIYPNPSKQVQCSPGRIQPKTAELRVPISEAYFLRYSSSVHVLSSCPIPCSYFTVDRKTKFRADNSWQDWSSELVVEMPKNSSVERASGPQYQWYIPVTLNTSRICDYSWVTEVEGHNKYSSVHLTIEQNLSRQELNSRVRVSKPAFVVYKRIVRAFVSDDTLHEINCSSNDELTYWQEEGSSGVTFLTIQNVRFDYAPFYTWFYGETYALYSEVMSIQGDMFESYFMPSVSKELESVKKQLCNQLEHLPVKALDLDNVLSNEAVANLSLQYQATAHFCTDNIRKCRNETVRIRLRLTQAKLRPWIFDTINCSNLHDKVNSKNIIDFNFDEAYRRKLEVIEFGDAEYFSCSKPAGVKHWSYSGFSRYFAKESCETLSSTFTNFLKWTPKSTNIVSQQHLLEVEKIALTCKKLLEAYKSSSPELKKDSEVFVKYPFVLQSSQEENNERAVLIWLDYKHKVASWSPNSNNVHANEEYADDGEIEEQTGTTTTRPTSRYRARTTSRRLTLTSAKRTMKKLTQPTSKSAIVRTSVEPTTSTTSATSTTQQATEEEPTTSTMTMPELTASSSTEYVMENWKLVSDKSLQSTKSCCSNTQKKCIPKRTTTKMNYKHLKISDLEDEEKDSHDQVQLSEGTNKKKVSGDSVTGSALFPLILSISLVIIIFAFLMLVLMHYAYVALRWKNNGGRKTGDNCFVMAAQLGTYPTPVVPEANLLNTNESVDRVLDQIESIPVPVTNDNPDKKMRKLDENAFQNWQDRVLKNDGKQTNTLPTLRRVCFPTARTKMPVSGQLDLEDTDVMDSREELNSQTTAECVRARSLKTMQLNEVESTKPVEGRHGYFTLDFCEVPFSGGSLHTISTKCSSYVFLHAPDDESLGD